MIRSQLRSAALAALLVAAPAFAETPAPKPPPSTIPEKIAPGAEPTGPAKNLSEKLKQSGGVIQPKEDDSGIEKRAPQPGDPNVIPPPTGGSQAPEPK